MLRHLRPHLLAPLAAAALLAGCASASQECANGICQITLSGKGASVEAGGQGSTIELVGTGNGTAEVDVAGTRGTLRVGVPVGFGRNSTITLLAVKGDEAKLKLDTTTAPEDAATQEGASSGDTATQEGAAPATTPHAGHTFGQSGRKGG